METKPSFKKGRCRRLKSSRNIDFDLTKMKLLKIIFMQRAVKIKTFGFEILTNRSKGRFTKNSSSDT